MNWDLNIALSEKYPKIFPYSEFYIACGDGWYHILDTMCAAIQAHIDDRNANRTTVNLVTGEKEILPPIPQVVAIQIKEKFAGLRFYYDGGDEYINGLVQMAELMCERTCEVCGDRGKLYTTGWHKTLCEKHAKERYSENI